MDDPERRWVWRLLAALLILASAALHVAYLVRDCPLDLAPDEAHYWDWSRHLDWSYYSKGPLVALLIRGSCELFGPWSEAVCGSPMIAIRLPAVACGALLLASLYVLTVQTLRSEKLAAAVVAVALTLPIVAAGASLMTIDAPYAACWVWALVAGHRAAVRRSAWAWPVAGLLVGFWFACWAAAMWADRPGRAASADRRYLWWTSAPTFALFLLASVRTSGQLNWAVTAYLSGLVLTAAWLRDRLAAPAPRVRRLAALGTAATCALGMALTLAVHFSAVTRPVLLSIAGPPSEKHPI